ncbi:MAG: hypothetical protein U0175_31050 [Caldilineaceae bacterium]
MNISSRSAYRPKNLSLKAEWRRVQFDVAGTRLLRQRLLEIGQAMVDSGLLEHAAEIFFLSPEEVQEARKHFADVQQPAPILPPPHTQAVQVYR